MTALRRIAQALAIPVALLLAVTLQLAVVNRAPFPGGATPDLVLLTVAAIAVCTGPVTGMLAGFCSGLAVDIAPPAAHLAGEYALVFCLVGYACGRARNAITYATGEQTMVTSLTVMALGVAAGEAGKAALGMMLSDPDVTSPAIKHVLPVAIIYDLLLCPFAYWLISLVLRRPAPERAPRPEFAQVATAFRAASAGALGAVPTLRLAGSTPPPARPPVRQEPKLRLGGGRSSALSGTYAASSPAHTSVASGRAVKLNFDRNQPATPRPWQRAAPGKGWLQAGRLGRPAGSPAVQPASPPKGWLRARPSGRPTGAPVLKHRPPPKGWLRAGPPTGATPLRHRSPGKGWLRAGRPAGTPAVQSGSPPKGWLHAERAGGTPALSRKSPAKGWLRPAKPVSPARRRKPGRGWLRPAKPAKLSWYAKSPSSQWVRRSHSPWRNRRRRLLALVGVRK
jgi:rod shape-determining protein MreD